MADDKKESFNFEKDLPHAIGRAGEEAACAWLRTHHYDILKRNYRAPCGEIDLIAREGRSTVFIEVKTRTNDGFGYPAEAVDRRKRRQIVAAATWYVHAQSVRGDMRFDVVEVFYDHASGTCRDITVIRDAFTVDDV